jgi:hypothetical protein
MRRPDDSHPSRKNKNAARVGHPRVVVDRDLWFPTQSERTLPHPSKAWMGHPRICVGWEMGGLRIVLSHPSVL